MQNRYVADIGDFGKFQLFRFLFNTPSSLSIHTLAQIWFLHEDETHNNDGKHVHYFERVKGSDTILESIMIEIVQQNRRDVTVLEEKNILNKARFFYPHIPHSYHDRKIWLEKAISFSHGHTVVAVAPDNGMALKCHKKEQTFSFLSLEDKKSTPHKYIFLEEIEAFFYQEKRAITIVYQHLGRCFSHDKQIRVLKEMLEEKFGYVLAIKHTPYSPRVFFFLCKEKEVFSTLHHALKDFEKKNKAFWKLY